MIQNWLDGEIFREEMEVVDEKYEMENQVNRYNVEFEHRNIGGLLVHWFIFPFD